MVKSKLKPQPSDETVSQGLTPREEKALQRQAKRERQQAINFLVSSFLGCLVLGGILGAVGGAKAAVGGSLGLFSIIASYKYPRKALWFFLIYMPFSGTVVYGLAGGNALMQLAKDVFYFPALIALFLEYRKKRTSILPKGLMPTLWVLLAFCLLTLLFVNAAQEFFPPPIDPLNPRKPENPLAMGILGFKILIGYVPLIFCAQCLIKDKKTLLFAMRLHVILAIICCVLTLVQFMMLKTGRCQVAACVGVDCFKASLGARCFVGGALLYNPEFGVIRLPGTFVAPWQWGWFLIANAFINFASAFSEPSLLWRPISLVSMALIFVLSVVSGQRIALALVPLSTIILLILTGQVANLKRFIPVGVGLGVILGGAAVLHPEILQQRIDSFVERWNASPPTAFIEEQFLSTLRNQDSLLGEGLGRATNATRAFGNVRLIETFYPKLIYEIGIPGTLAFLALVTALVVLTFKAYRSVKDRNLRSYGASLWVFVLFISYNTYYYPLDVDPVAVYYWFFAGVILTLPAIDRQEQLKAQALAQAQEAQAKSKKRKRKQKQKQAAKPT